MSRRQEERRELREKNKITTTLPGTRVKYPDKNHKLTAAQRAELESIMLSKSPFKEISDVLKDVTINSYL